LDKKRKRRTKNNIKMKQKIKSIIITTGGMLGISLSVFFFTFIVLAWTGPLHTPPTCGEGEVGCDEVLHTGTTAQSKIGGLLLNTGGATNGLIVSQGNVGIGTASPAVELEVAGQVKITGGTPGEGKVLTSDATGTGTWTTLPASLTKGSAVYQCPFYGATPNCYPTCFGQLGNMATCTSGVYNSNQGQCNYTTRTCPLAGYIVN
jgi:hypothetical protein